jgi:hypothetical protein
LFEGEEGIAQVHAPRLEESASGVGFGVLGLQCGDLDSTAAQNYSPGGDLGYVCLDAEERDKRTEERKKTG